MSPAETILVVDDEPDAHLLLQRAFARAGILSDLRGVGDGDQAIAYLSGEGCHADRAAFPLPRIVLLDLKLPRRSGIEVLAWIRQNGNLETLPVIVLTSSKNRDDVTRAYHAGANSYLVKPTSLHELTDVVRSLSDYWLAHNEGLSSDPLPKFP